MKPDENGYYDLERFTVAQARVYEGITSELRRGRKREHWMWFIFPQIAGLGHSPSARAFAIRSLEEARAYLAHPVLGPRLRQCTQLVLAHEGTPAEQIFRSIDTLKFRSCMTLFERASNGEAIFADALAAFFEGERDRTTMDILDGGALRSASSLPSDC
ncbi:MAG: DUF1810 domain-containing protein [Vulcanimicrobiaceae bacterium]